MKISDITLNITDISDALTLGQNTIVEEIFSIAEKIIDEGGKIIIQRKYENAPPDVLAEYSTQEEIKNWKAHINNAQNILKKSQIK